MTAILPEFNTEFQFEELIQHFKDKITERSKAHKYVSIERGGKVLADKLVERFDVSSEGSTRELHFYGYHVNPVRGEDGAIRGFNESVPNEPVIRIRLRKLPGKKGTNVQATVLDDSYRKEAMFLTEHLGKKQESGNGNATNKRGPNAGTEAKVREAHRRLKAGVTWDTLKKHKVCTHETYMKWCYSLTGEVPITK